MSGSSKQCHFVTIRDDDMCELPPEHFFADLELVSGVGVDINIETTRIVIDDSGEDECGKLKHTLFNRNRATTL